MNHSAIFSQNWCEKEKAYSFLIYYILVDGKHGCYHLGRSKFIIKSKIIGTIKTIEDSSIFSLKSILK